MRPRPNAIWRNQKIYLPLRDRHHQPSPMAIRFAHSRSRLSQVMHTCTCGFSCRILLLLRDKYIEVYIFYRMYTSTRIFHVSTCVQIQIFQISRRPDSSYHFPPQSSDEHRASTSFVVAALTLGNKPAKLTCIVAAGMACTRPSDIMFHLLEETDRRVSMHRLDL